MALLSKDKSIDLQSCLLAIICILFGILDLNHLAMGQDSIVAMLPYPSETYKLSDYQDVVLFTEDGLDNTDVQMELSIIAATSSFVASDFSVPSKFNMVQHVIGDPAYSFSGNLVSGAYTLTAQSLSNLSLRKLYVKPRPVELSFFPGQSEYLLREQSGLTEAVDENALYRFNEGPIAHEYAHAFMFESLLNETGKVGKMAKLQRDWARIVEIKMLADHLKGVGLSASGEERENQFIEERDQFESHLGQLPRDIQEARQIIGSELKPHFELFADLVAVVMTRNPDIVDENSRNGGHTYSSGRSLLSDPDFDPNSYRASFYNPYTYFRGVRQVYLAPTLSQILQMPDAAKRNKSLKSLLKATYRAIVADLVRIATDISKRPSVISFNSPEARKHNEWLAKKISLEFELLNRE